MYSKQIIWQTAVRKTQSGHSGINILLIIDSLLISNSLRKISNFWYYRESAIVKKKLVSI
jgi:hypothetical protein